MTVYVDDMRRAASSKEIAGYRGRPAKWSHMMADTPNELKAFAVSLGLNLSWIQNKGTHREHFDVTETVRLRAINNGAVAITYPSGMAELIDKRRGQCKCTRLDQCKWGELVS